MQENDALGLIPDWASLNRNRERPNEPPAMLQTWSDLLFLHAAIEPSVLQSMLPDGLTIETFDGSAWLGFVPFRMSGIHPRRLPAIPWLSTFCETNIRTYVSHPEHGSGVWFFSLDASRYLGCLIARMWFSLPYFHASLAIASRNDMRAYIGHRFAAQPLPALPIQTSDLGRYEVVAKKIGDWYSPPEQTFEYWLVERYRLYAMDRKRGLATARVWHQPYVVAQAEPQLVHIEGLNEGLGPLEFRHALVARTLNVECFSPHPA